MSDYKDYPIDEVLDNIDRLAGLGHECYVKYTCTTCGSRQTSDEANTWHEDGYFCEECGCLTVPKGINFLCVMKVRREGKTERVDDSMKT